MFLSVGLWGYERHYVYKNGSPQCPIQIFPQYTCCQGIWKYVWCNLSRQNYLRVGYYRYNSILANMYFRFSAVWHNHLRNKHLAEHLRNNSNELATVRFSAVCGAMLSNNPFICKYNLFFRKNGLSTALFIPDTTVALCFPCFLLFATAQRTEIAVLYAICQLAR